MKDLVHTEGGPSSSVIAGIPFWTKVVSIDPGSPGSILITSGRASWARRALYGSR